MFLLSKGFHYGYAPVRIACSFWKGRDTSFFRPDFPYPHIIDEKGLPCLPQWTWKIVKSPLQPRVYQDAVEIRRGFHAGSSPITPNR